MKHFKATLDIKETALNAQNFVKENKSVFWDVFKPLIPYLIGFFLIDIIISLLLMTPDPETGEIREFSIGELFSAYISTCLIISWHRVVLHGPDKYQAMNPLKPQKADLAYIGVGLLIFLVIPIAVGALIGLIIGISGTPAIALLFLPVFIALVFFGLKVVFYFPSKATGNDITLKQSIKMTDGYIWKMFAAGFLANLKTLGYLILYLIAGLLALGMTGFIAVSLLNDSFLEYAGFIVGSMLSLPIILYFQPLLTILGVTVLSNYYQHALQNKPEALSSET